MELLLSNIPPLKSGNRSFSGCINELISEADCVRIACGYISAEALIELKKTIEINGKPYLDLMIGMHYYDGITRQQYDAAISLNKLLVSKCLGKISVATTFKFHGKLYSFEKNGKLFSAIMGSSNLGSMLDVHRNFETDLLLSDSKIISEVDAFIQEAIKLSSTSVSDWIPQKYIENSNLLEGHDCAERVSKEELFNIKNDLNGIVFVLPLKATPQSNLNCHFGKPRGKITRHWYEVEIIVPQKIRNLDSYPLVSKPESITVYTDDGWKFECTHQGSKGKNFRSSKDLKIIGKWIKGRLVHSGVLEMGEFITEEILEKYGRKTLTLKGTSNSSIWILDFGVYNDK